MNHRFDTSKISGLDIRMGIPINKNNCQHLPELIQYALRDLHNAERMPHATAVMAKAKDDAVAKAKQVLADRQAKLELYREIFPDLNL